MDFQLTEEQQLLKDSVERFLDRNYSFDLRRKLISERQAMSAQIWEGFAGIGLLGVPFAEGYGGFGGGGVETMLVCESLGRHLALEPYISTVVLAGGLIDLGAEQKRKSALLSRIIDGSLLVAFAHFEPQSRYSLGHVELRAERDGDGWRLHGRKTLVLHGSVADSVIVSARTQGAPDDAHGVSLFIVDCHDPGLNGQEYPLFDGSRALDLQFDGTRVAADGTIGPLDGAMPLIERSTARAIAALCAEAVGIMARLQEMTLEYLKTRQQFGVPIGRFQALQHRAVDMFVQVEQARSMAIMAAGFVDSDNAFERQRAVTAAKAFIGRAGRFVGQQAIQLHGGIGMTDELAVGHYVKRLAAIDILFGDAAYQQARFAQIRDEAPATAFARPRNRWTQI